MCDLIKAPSLPFSPQTRGFLMISPQLLLCTVTLIPFHPLITYCPMQLTDAEPQMWLSLAATSHTQLPLFHPCHGSY